jgi:site-specific DNA recombinase
MRGRLANGGGNQLYGMLFVKGEGRREIDPATAPIVKQIFEWIGDEGMTLYAVAKRLNDRGIPTPAGGANWQVATLSPMVRNPAYTGTPYAYRRQTVPTKRQRNPQSERGSVKYRPQDEWIAIPGATARIVSDELFQRAQEQIQSNQKNATRNAKHPYLLSGRIRCAECGRAFTGTTRNITYKDGSVRSVSRYRCSSQASLSVQRCPIHTVRVDAADAAVWEYVKSLLEHPDLIIAELEKKRAMQDANQYERDLEGIRGQLEKLAARERKILNLALTIEDDAESAALFQRERQTIIEQRSRLHTEEERIRSQMDRDTITADTIADVQAYCERVKAKLSSFTMAEKRLALDALNIKVLVNTDGSLTVEGYVPCQSVLDLSSTRTCTSGRSIHRGTRWSRRSRTCHCRRRTRRSRIC